jgi:hypothetical protein
VRRKTIQAFAVGIFPFVHVAAANTCQEQQDDLQQRLAIACYAYLGKKEELIIL